MSAKKLKSDGTDSDDPASAEDSSNDKTSSDTEVADVVEATFEEIDVSEDDPEKESSTELDVADVPEDEADAADESTETLSDDDVEAEELVEDELNDAETSPEAESEPVAAQSTEPEKIVERVVEKRGSFFPALFGGIVAAGLGFAVGITDLLTPYLPAGLQRGAAAPDLSKEVAALQTRLDELSATLGSTPQSPDLSGVEALIQDGLSGQTEDLSKVESNLSARLDTLEARITDIAQQPVESAISDEAVAAYERELAAVQGALAQQRAEVENMISEAAEMEAEASESARVAQAQAAATRLFVALETGAPFSTEVTELQGLGVTVPAALVASSEGLVALGTLQAEFPELARLALGDAREAEGGAGGLSGFLQRQLGARSVTPRDGDDPDAVLSRAEAALAAGDLDQALTELNTLPDTARPALEDWEARVAARRNALAAADTLAESLASN